MVHLPLFAVSVPANVMLIEGILIPIVMFDILDKETLFSILDKVGLGGKENEGSKETEEPEILTIPS